MGTVLNVFDTMKYGLDEENYDNLQSLGIDVELVTKAYEAFEVVGGFGLRINNLKEHNPDKYYYVWGWYD